MRVPLTAGSVHLRDRAVTMGIVLTLVAAWEMSAGNGWIDALIFPKPTKILATLVNLWRADLLESLRVTLTRFFSGVVCGSVPGVLLGLAIGSSPRVSRIIDPMIAAIHPLPKIVLFPLFIVIFGVSEWSKIASIALTVFFPSLINSAAGARQISPLYLEVVRSYGGGRAAALRNVVIPGSLPMILNGLRIASNLGLLVTIAIEFTVMSPGIGSIIWVALQTMRTEQLWAGIIVISLVGIIINMPIQWLLRRVASWQ